MREMLSDVVKQTASLFEIIKVTGSDKETKIQAVDVDKTLFLQATLKTPQAELIGEFGISNLAMLNGLLNFSSYKTDDATFKVKRGEVGGISIVEQFEFRDAKNKGADFRAMSAKLVGDQAVIANIPWDVSLIPSKAKIAEFSQLSGFFSEVSKGTFLISTEGTDVVLTIGESGSSTHRASLVFATDVKGTLKGELAFSIQQFLTVLKLAGTSATTLNVTSRGVMSLVIETEFATYNYFLRGKK